jgi:hypothetical protein
LCVKADECERVSSLGVELLRVTLAAANELCDREAMVLVKAAIGASAAAGGEEEGEGICEEEEVELSCSSDAAQAIVRDAMANARSLLESFPNPTSQLHAVNSPRKSSSTPSDRLANGSKVNEVRNQRTKASDDDVDEEEEEEEQLEPCLSDEQIAGMKVVELKAELKSRELSTTGLKRVLATRLLEFETARRVHQASRTRTRPPRTRRRDLEHDSLDAEDPVSLCDSDSDRTTASGAGGQTSAAGAAAAAASCRDDEEAVSGSNGGGERGPVVLVFGSAFTGVPIESLPILRGREGVSRMPSLAFVLERALDARRRQAPLPPAPPRDQLKTRTSETGSIFVDPQGTQRWPNAFVFPFICDSVGKWRRW